MTRAKGFAAWKPQKRTLVVLRDIEVVLEEYRAYLPLTVRQVFYRLVGKGYQKTENFYENVQDKCNRARRSGRIPFSSIRDDGVSRRGGETHGYYETPDDYYRTHDKLHNYYNRSWHEEQPAFISVLCEAAGMVPMLARVADRYRVPVASSSGFDSLTVKYDLYSEAAERMEEFGQDTILLHLGDHDPSGVALHESMADDFDAFALDHSYDPLIDLRRVALTPEQIVGYGIEPDPEGVKPSDSRSKSFIQRGLEPAAQLEAIPPDTLIALVRQEIERTLDMEALRASQERERREREEVQTKLNGVNEVLREAFGLEEEEGW